MHDRRSSISSLVNAIFSDASRKSQRASFAHIQPQTQVSAQASSCCACQARFCGNWHLCRLFGAPRTCQHAVVPDLDNRSKPVTVDSVLAGQSLQRRNSLPQKLRKRTFTQLHLDAGQVVKTCLTQPCIVFRLRQEGTCSLTSAMQASFACTTCAICGLVYAKGEASDEKIHADFHTRFTAGVKFQASLL